MVSVRGITMAVIPGGIQEQTDCSNPVADNNGGSRVSKSLWKDEILGLNSDVVLQKLLPYNRGNPWGVTECDGKSLSLSGLQEESKREECEVEQGIGV